MEWITMNQGDEEDPNFVLGLLADGHLEIYAFCESMENARFLRDAVIWYQSFLEAGTLALPEATPVKKSRSRAGKKNVEHPES